MLLLAVLAGPALTRGDGDLGRVGHVIVAMQENHSFDSRDTAIPAAPPPSPADPGCPFQP